MKIAVIGTGYVGLVVGAGFADLGHDVTCVDIDARRVAALMRGELPFHEPGLTELVARAVAAGRLQFAATPAVAGARVVFLAVGTPEVCDAAAAIAPALDADAAVVVKSTAPVGTVDKVAAIVGRPVAANPEFLREGAAVHDFFEPARVVIGADDPALAERLRGLYAHVADRVVVMAARSAELTKYAANAMLATRISFMNELARVCELAGADIEEVRAGIGSDPRIGPEFLVAGAGFGGSCLPKDLRALVELSRDLDAPLSIVDAALRANERARRALGDRVLAHLRRCAGTRVAIWGLAFKPDTDDIRESPALELVDQLHRAGVAVVAHDPVAMASVRARLGDRLELAGDPYAAAAGADALVLVTEWPVFVAADLARLRALMRTPALFDGRNAWSPATVRAAGLAYTGIGRP